METERDAVERPNHHPDDAIGGPLSSTATEWLIDAADCDATLLSNLEHLRQTCDAVVDGLHLRVIGDPQWHRFPARRASPEPGGVTGLYLLAESHLTCHTFPEDRLAAFNLYCCRGCVAWDWQRFLRERLGAGTVVVRSIVRGAAASQLSSTLRLASTVFDPEAQTRRELAEVRRAGSSPKSTGLPLGQERP